jgi:hypothetical protein
VVGIAWSGEQRGIGPDFHAETIVHQAIGRFAPIDAKEQHVVSELNIRR